MIRRTWGRRRSGGSRGGTRSACTSPWATGHRRRRKPSTIDIKRHKPPHYKGGTKKQAISSALFDRPGLRRTRAARLRQQPDGLRPELRRASRAFRHGPIISHRARGNTEQKQFISHHLGARLSSPAAVPQISCWNIGSLASGGITFGLAKLSLARAQDKNLVTMYHSKEVEA